MKDKRSSSWVELYETSEVVESLEEKAPITKKSRTKNDKQELELTNWAK